MTQRALMTPSTVKEVSNEAEIVRLQARCDAYKGVVYMLLNPNLDYKRIVERLAAEHPEIFIELQHEIDWKVKAKEFCRTHDTQKIQCIKYVRELTGMGLKEAKEWVEKESGYFGGPRVTDDPPF